jgi:hypothetical protein
MQIFGHVLLVREAEEPDATSIDSLCSTACPRQTVSATAHAAESNRFGPPAMGGHAMLCAFEVARGTSMKRLKIAVASSVLAAGLVGGFAFAGTGPGHVGHCAALQARIKALQTNPARKARLGVRVAQMQAQYQKECVTTTTTIKPTTTTTKP